jgi:hypothetical protein
LTDALFDRLAGSLSRSISRKLEGLESTVTEAELWEIVAPIEDADHRIAIHDIFSLLRQDRIREAQERARLYLGDTLPLEQVPGDELPELVDSDVIRRIDPNSRAYGEALARFMVLADYREWMLFMHPKQDEVVAEDFSGPAKLVGVSGSGKTCVVVQRAVRLAQIYPYNDILVVTLNKALALLIKQLVNACATDGERRRIIVKSFFSLCQEQMLSFEPHKEKWYNEVTWKTSEHVDEVWQEYYRCGTRNFDARVLQPVHDALLARGWNPEKYLREEIDWLRSALSPEDRQPYLTMERKGRSVPLTTSQREMILAGAEGWEAKMSAIGVIDNLGIAQAVSKYMDRIRPKYRSILIDEAQDFGNIELSILKRLVEPDDNDIFLCGDAAQAVTTKYQAFKEIGISIPGARSRKLLQNYRNSRDVLNAAHQVLYTNMTEDVTDREDFEILDPEYSTFTASTPLLLSASNLEEEIANAYALVNEVIGQTPGKKGCIAICGFSLYELEMFSKRIGLPVLDGTTNVDAHDMFLSDLEQTKGFEFDIVCVLNCSTNVLPSSTAPESERHRDLARLYVAMTRAKRDLVVSWSVSPSPFFKDLDNHFLTDTWAHYNSALRPKPYGAPEKLDIDREAGSQPKDWKELSAEQFLYTGDAFGLSSELIAKMRDLVNGAGLKKGSLRLKWRTMGQAADDFRRRGSARRLWGPEVGKQFRELIDRLQPRAGRTERQGNDHDELAESAV